MKKIFSFLALAASLLTLSACAAPAAAATPAPTATPVVEYKKISAADAKARMDSGDEIIILDVRTQEEYDAGHIAGAILVPNETIIDEQPELLPDLDAEILVYCRSGNRSAQAARALRRLGHPQAFSLAGGLALWPERDTASA